MPLHLIVNNENCCVTRLLYSVPYAQKFCVNTEPDYIQRENSLFRIMAQFGWSILMDAADLEAVLVVLLVLEILHNKYLLKMMMYRQYLPFILRLGA